MTVASAVGGQSDYDPGAGRRHAPTTGLAEKEDDVGHEKSLDQTRFRPPAVVTPRQPSSRGTGSSMEMASRVKVAPMVRRPFQGDDLGGDGETKQVIQQMKMEGGSGRKLRDESDVPLQGVGGLAARRWLLSKGERKTLKLLKRIRSPDGFLHRAGLSMILAKLEVQDPEPLLDRLHARSGPNTSKDLVSETVFLEWVGFEKRDIRDDDTRLA